MCTISLCMITKNEEKNIKNCLESAMSLADEIIIVDTGSTDNTKSICQSFNAKIYDHPWNDNFSDARNFCISKASSDWILWLDADEQLIIRNNKLKDDLSKNTAIIYSVQMLHMTDNNSDENMTYYISYHNRLFKNNCGFYFQGSIHESLANSDMAAFDNMIINESIALKHYGYINDTAAEKSLRNLKMLLKEKDKQTDDPWIDYHLAAEFYRCNDLNRAYAMVNHSLAGFIEKNLMPPAIAYKLKYEIISKSNDQDNAVTGINKAIALYPDYVELHFLKGMILYKQHKYNEAIKAFQKCIILGEFNPKYLILSGSGSFRACYYIGKCYEELGNINRAKEYYRQSLLYNPGFETAAEQLKNINSKKGHKSQAMLF